MIPKQKIYGISYASRNFRGRLKQNEVYKNCDLFDIFNMYNENDIDKIAPINPSILGIIGL